VNPSSSRLDPNAWCISGFRRISGLRSRWVTDRDRTLGQLVMFVMDGAEVVMQKNGHLAFAPRA
jgi:hypothetical protein